MAESTTDQAVSKRKAQSDPSDSTQQPTDQSQKKQKGNQPDTATRLSAHSVLAMRWDAASIAKDSQNITIEFSTRVPKIRLLLYNLFSFKDEGVAVGDLDIFAATLSRDSGDSILSLKYDGSDETPIKEIKGICYVRDVVDLGDSDLLLIARPKNADPWGLRGMIYRKPLPLGEIEEFEWEFELPYRLLEQFGKPLSKHIQCFHRREKTVVPIYSFSSGVGTGVTRNAQEFLKTCIRSCWYYYGTEKKLLQRAKVFHVCLGETEKDAPYDSDLEGTNVDSIIAARMIQQLSPLAERPSLVSIYQKGKIPSTLQILKAIRQNEGKRLDTETKPWVAVIVVDGLELLNPKRDDDSLIQTFLKHLGTMTLAGSLLLVCVAGHTYTPLIDFAKSSGQKVVHLPVSRLSSPSLISKDGKKHMIFDEKHHILKLMVKDCGGHARTLQDLTYELSARWNLTPEVLPLKFVTTNLKLELVRSTIKEMKQSYGNFFPSIDRKDLLCIIRAVISQRSFAVTDQIPGADLILDSILVRGPFNFVRSEISSTSTGYLEAPYIWVSAALDYLKETGNGFEDQDRWLFQFLSLFDYDNIISIQNDIVVLHPPDSCKTFSCFVASFRCLRSRLFGDGEEVSIGQLHSGAFIKDEDRRFINRHLKFDITEIHPSTEGSELVRCNTGTAGYFHAPVGHGCLALTLEKRDQATRQVNKFTEVGHFNLPEGITRTKPIFDGEKSKVPVAGEDLIMFYTPKRIHNPEALKLGPMEGLVDESRWDAYFGLFADRARLLYGQG